MVRKLTMVSVTVRGRRITRFVMATINEQGKARVPASYVTELAGRLGCSSRGDTFTIG